MTHPLSENWTIRGPRLLLMIALGTCNTGAREYDTCSYVANSQRGMALALHLRVQVRVAAGGREGPEACPEEIAMRYVMVLTLALMLCAGSGFASADNLQTNQYQAGVYPASATADVWRTDAYDASQWQVIQPDQTDQASVDFESDPFATTRTFDFSAQATDFTIPDQDLVIFEDPPLNGVPEPATMTLFGLGLAGAAVAYRRKARRR